MLPYMHSDIWQSKMDHGKDLEKETEHGKNLEKEMEHGKDLEKEYRQDLSEENSELSESVCDLDNSLYIPQTVQPPDNSKSGHLIKK